MSSTVIVGAGIIGVSTALYLADHQPGSTLHLVEAAPELFSSASGYAGGFLAKDWFTPAVTELGALGYEEHRRVADKYGGRERWGYTSTTSLSYSAASSTGPKRRGNDWVRDGTSRAEVAPPVAEDLAGKTPAWLRRAAGDDVEVISGDDTTAQVNPLHLSQALLQECQKLGVQLHHPATVLSVSTDVRGQLARVRIADTQSSTETDVPCTRLIIAAGVWSGEVFQQLFKHAQVKLPIASLAGHSLVVKSPRWHAAMETQGCHAIYTTSGEYSPEVYSRLGGQLYLAGINSSTMPLPKVLGKQPVQSADMAKLKDIARALLGPEAGDDDLEVVREGLCFRPVTPWGTPIITRIEDEQLGPGMATRPGADGGVFVAAGHGPWGISMCLSTGMVLAQLAQGQPTRVDISGLGLRS